MPRKQRFKPSRKPKPIPTTLPDAQSTLDGSTAQHIDMSRPPESERAPGASEARGGQHSNEAESR
jgi:hypothetical protein